IEPELAILMLTAVNDATSAALCMQRGAMDYLTKPIELADLGRAVQRALKRREMLLENRQLNQWLKEEVSTRTAELQRERMKLERLSVATLEALVNALEAKDPYMRGHSARVADLSATVAHELGIPEEDVEHVRVAGRLHDIGKIGTRESVLNKQGTLTPEEFEHVKQHVIIGSQILAPLARVPRRGRHSLDLIGSVVLIAVTGATGFLGRHITTVLARRGHTVRALVRDPHRASTLESLGVELIPGDLADAGALTTLMRAANAVVHLVGIIVEMGRATFHAVHVEGTRRVVEAAR